MEHQGLKFWMKEAPGIIIADLPEDDLPIGSKFSGTLRRCSSEVEVSISTFDGYEVIKSKNEVVIKDIVPSVSSSVNTLVSRDFFEKEIEDYEKNTELEFSFNTGKPSGLSRSCTTLQTFSGGECYSKMRVTRSYCDIKQRPEKKEGSALNFEALRAYNEASRIYELYKRSSNIEKDFLQAEYEFQLLYPNYWKHLVQKCKIHLNPQTIEDEKEAQLDIIDNCKALIEEEEQIGDEGSTSIEFSGDDLMNDLQLAVPYLKRKYPYLFTYLINKHDFEELSIQKIKVLRNQREIMKIFKEPLEKLTEREEKYSSK